MPKEYIRQPFWKTVFLIPAGVSLKLLLAMVWRRPTPRTRVLIRHDDKILMVSNITSPWQWTLPGGGYNANETASECSAREIREELAIDISVNEYTFIGHYRERIHGVTWRYDCTQAMLHTQPFLRLSMEIFRAKWLPIDTLPSSTPDYIQKAIAAVEK